MTHRLPPLHPGEVLREEFMAPYGLTAYRLADALLIPRPRIERLVREKTSVSADTALRLARYFNTSGEFWLNLQARHDIETRARKITPQLRRIKRAKRRQKAVAA